MTPFLDALGADGPAADHAGKMDLYGRFVGSWDLDVTQFREDGSKRQRKGEWHFGWALEGRAIQDVWIVPPRGELRHGDAAANFNSYGTTLRVYDPRIDAWQIQWTDPVTQNFLRMIGRKQGDDIVQLGTGRESDTMELFGDHAQFLSLAGRNLDRRGNDLAPQRRILCPACRLAPASALQRDLSHRGRRGQSLAFPGASGLRRFRGACAREERKHDWS
jgi:hypothetical protein